MRRRAGIALALLLAAAIAGCGGKAKTVKGSGPEGVSFVVTPSEAEVLVDNVVQGKASDFPDDHPLKIPVGTHVLELRAADYLSYVRPLAVTPQAKRIEATLVHKETPPAPPATPAKEKSVSP